MRERIAETKVRLKLSGDVHNLRVYGGHEWPLPVRQFIGAAPAGRVDQEFVHGAQFGYCLELWCSKTVLITPIREDASDYKGIDFLLSRQPEPNKYQAFQLLEWHGRFTPADTEDALAEYIPRKKHVKGDSRVHLVVRLIPYGQRAIDVGVLHQTLPDMPFASISLFGVIQGNHGNMNMAVSCSAEGRLQVATASFAEHRILMSDGECPYFK